MPRTAQVAGAVEHNGQWLGGSCQPGLPFAIYARLDSTADYIRKRSKTYIVVYWAVRVATLWAVRAAVTPTSADSWRAHGPAGEKLEHPWHRGVHEGQVADRRTTAEAAGNVGIVSQAAEMPPHEPTVQASDRAQNRFAIPRI